MDAELLDRLLMDQALEALPPDTAALLAAYLSHDEAAALRAQEFDAAADAARCLLRQPTSTALPPFPVVSTGRLDQARRRLRVLRSAAAVAAAFVLGIGLGLTMHVGARDHSRGAAPTAVRSTGLQSTRHLVSAANAATTEGSFWSTQRLAEKSRREPPRDSVPLIWHSVVSLPKPGGTL